MTLTLADIQIRDPFILPLKDRGLYYLFGTTDTTHWQGPPTGFNCYRSPDLKNWEGPLPAFRPAPDFWATSQFWAPEVHLFNDRYYMFATFNSKRRLRGTQILVASRPEGPYLPWSDGPVTPADWECLDGTLHVDQQGSPWMIFCHEWTQIHDGAICALRLAPDLKHSVGKPVLLFHASEAPWVRNMDGPVVPKKTPNYVTDGPFLYRAASGSLLMLWSSSGARGYAMGVARSASGTVVGPWSQETRPLWERDGGHGMIFRAFDGSLCLTFHTPNETPKERALLLPVVENGNALMLARSISA